MTQNTYHFTKHKWLVSLMAFAISFTLLSVPAFAATQAKSSLTGKLSKSRNQSGWLATTYKKASPNFKGKSVSVTEQTVNIRIGPGTDFAKLTSVKKGQTLVAVGQQGQWYKIRLQDGRTGWIAGWLVQVVGRSATNPSSSTGQNSTGTVNVPISDKYFVIKSTSVNVRSGPGTQYSIVASANAGQKYVANLQQGDWIRVTLSSAKQGWIASRLGQLATITVSDRGGETSSDPNNGSDTGTSTPATDAIQLQSVDVQLDSGRETAVISTDKAMNYNIIKMNSPDRLIVDIEKCSVGDVNDVQGSGGYITGIRVSQYSATPMLTRVVIDLNVSIGYSAQLSQDGRSLSVSVKEKSISDKTIVIDAGHGGTDPGAIGISGVKEKDVNLAIAQLIRDELVSLGANVVMTRDDDTFISLTDRCTIANNASADMFIAVHANASTSATLNGTTTYFYAPSSNTSLYAQLQQRQSLASIMQKKMVSALGTKDDGILQANFAVLRGTAMPSILLETGFLSNAKDEAMLKQQVNREALAKAVAEGAQEYFMN